MIVTIVVIICAVTTVWYLSAVSILYRGFKRLPVSGETNNHTFSIVVAARNEEKNIAGCLVALLEQTIDRSRFEIIVVNDRSDDDTAGIVTTYAQRSDLVRLFSVAEVPPGIAPKKNAVAIGIGKARNEIIVFTDADCIVQSSWLETIDRFFTADTGLLQGMTSYHYIPLMNQIFFGLQAVDFLSHNIVSAAAIGAGLPINSNANNMAFRKQVFRELGGYGADQQVISGDDDLLLQRVWRSKKWKVRFMADPAGAVTTVPTSTLRGVFEQRKRWGSKAIHYSVGQTLFLTGIFMFYCSIVLTGIFSLFDTQYLAFCTVLLFVKMAGEAVLMIPGTALFDKRGLRRYIIPASLLQLPVVLGAVLAGTFGTFSWKGDLFHRKTKV